MNKSGYLYYVRLKTKMGIFYKVGFTSMNSVEERFSYNNSKDYQLIDKVLFFKYDNNAHIREQKIHNKFFLKKAFSKYSNKVEFPLAKNGQSELYFEDILEKDPDFCQLNAENTKLNVKAMELNNNILGYLFMFILFIVMFPLSLFIILFIFFFQHPIDKSVPFTESIKQKMSYAYNDLLELKYFFKTVFHLLKNYQAIQNMYLK